MAVKVLLTHGIDEIGKLQGLARAWPDIWQGRVLDIGCRTKALQRVLSAKNVQYYGFDLFAPADIIGNLEQGLPFMDAFFDTVVALDVLEHTDNIHKAFAELCRVSQHYILIVLPNAYDVVSRFRFLRGLPLSGKYGLPPTPPLDRHRWLFSWQEAKTFTYEISYQYGFEVVTETCLVGARRGFGPGRLIVGLFPNLLSQWYVALLQRQ